MPTSPSSGELSVITILPDGSVVENTNNADTGHVVLGVLGGIALVFIIVIIVVPVMRWRQRRGSSRATSSRASSRRTHDRIDSAVEAHVQAPLLESQDTDPAIREPVLSEKGKGREVFVDPGMMEIPRSWKILEKIPEFNDSDSLSSLGRPLASGEQKFQPVEKTAPERPNIIAATSSTVHHSSLTLEPHRQETDASQQSQTPTLVGRGLSDVQQPTSPTSPTSTAPPLTNAFSRSLSLISPISFSAVSGSSNASVFRYPSVAVSEASRSTVPSAGSQLSPEANAPSEVPSSRPQPLNLSTLTRTPTWFPNPHALSSGSNLHPTPAAPKAQDGRLRKGPMPSIPESLRSGFSASSSEVFATPSPPPPTQPSAKLREPLQSKLPSTVRHSRGLSSDTGVSFAASIDITRSNTSRTQRTSESAAEQEPPGSALTHYTFGHPVPPLSGITSPEFYKPPDPVPLLEGLPEAQQPVTDANTVPFPVQPSPAVTPGSGRSYILYETDGRKALQSRFSTDTESASIPVATAPTSEEDARRRTISFPREPSPPLIPAPLSHPPLPPLRHTGPSRALPTLPTLPPHLALPAEPAPMLPVGPSNLDHDRIEGEDEAPPSPSDSTESLIPRISTPQLTLGLRPVSPFRFDFGLGGGDSRSGTPAPGGGSGQLSRRSTQKSKASSSSRSGGSGRFSTKRSASRSKSREREGSSSNNSWSKSRGSRRVTFGIMPPSPAPSSGGGSRPPSRTGGTGDGQSGVAGVVASLQGGVSIRPLPPVPPVPPLPSSTHLPDPVPESVHASPVVP